MFPVPPLQNRRALLRTAGFSAALALLTPAQALEANVPQGPVILTVSGKIGQPNRGKQATFDMAMLRALPQHSFTTNTPWYSRPVKFTGLLEAVKAQGTVIQASAINDYRISIPVSDAYEHRVIVARMIDDQEVPVRLKGPLFVVYPFDEKTELRTSVYIERSIWQLRHMSIE
jgi:hypothetical protein